MQADETRGEVDSAEERWEKLMVGWPEFFFCRFRGRRLHPIKGWGTQYGLGWYDILALLLTELDAEARRLGRASPHIAQIKEKFGDLRVHLAFPHFTLPSFSPK